MGCNPQANWTTGNEVVPAVNTRLEELTNTREKAHQALQRKTQINKPVRTLETGQEAWLDARNIKTKAPSKKMEQKRLGPFTITKKISPVTYQLRLPSHMNIHPMFHIDLLMPYKETAEYSIPFKCLAPETIDGEEEYEIEEIISERRHGRKRQHQYLVSWKGYPRSDNSWVNETDINTPLLLAEFITRIRYKASRRVVYTLSKQYFTASLQTTFQNSYLSQPSSYQHMSSNANATYHTGPLTLNELCGYSTEDSTRSDASTICSGSTSPPPLTSGSTSPMSCTSGEDGWIKHRLYALLATIDKLETTQSTDPASTSSLDNHVGSTDDHLSIRMENTGTASVGDALRALRYKKECAEEEEEDTWRGDKNKKENDKQVTVDQIPGAHPG